jgi:uncharacterized protein (DUF1697 family)
MTRYVALLRAINVGGRVVRMERLREILQAAKLRNVETFIGSGNVIFDANGAADTRRLERKIEASLGAGLGFDVTTFLRTMDQIASVGAYDPFQEAAKPGARPTLFVGFAADTLPRGVQVKVDALTTKTDSFHVRGREIYWLCRVRSMQAIGLMGKLEKAAGVPVTFRTVNTLQRIAAKFGE